MPFVKKHSILFNCNYVTNIMQLSQIYPFRSYKEFKFVIASSLAIIITIMDHSVLND